jgi:hypothetical protein
MAHAGYFSNGHAANMGRQLPSVKGRKRTSDEYFSTNLNKMERKQPKTPQKPVSAGGQGSNLLLPIRLHAAGDFRPQRYFVAFSRYF